MTVEMIAAFVLAGVCVCIGACQFAEKGIPLNNAYLWTSKDERERMDKKPHYRQSAIVFCLMSAVFLVLGIAAALRSDRLRLLEIPLIVDILAYAVASSVRIEKRAKR